MLESLRPILTKVRLGLAPIDCEVFEALWGPRGLNTAINERRGTADPLVYPYSHIEMVSEPESSYVWESLGRFKFTAWGSQWHVSQIAGMMEWLDGHPEPGGLDAASLIYERTSRSYPPEPESYLPNGEEVRRLDDLYRVSYRKTAKMDVLLGGAV